MKVRSTASTIFILFLFGALSALAQSHPPKQQPSGPTIYSIGLLFSGNSIGGDERRARHALASQTGGIAFFPASLQDVDAVAAEVARDIRNQYILAYYSARASTAAYHSVKVQARASGRGKLTVHTRTG
jgi:hypothetical protein